MKGSWIESMLRRVVAASLALILGLFAGADMGAHTFASTPGSTSTATAACTEKGVPAESLSQLQGGSMKSGKDLLDHANRLRAGSANLDVAFKHLESKGLKPIVESIRSIRGEAGAVNAPSGADCPTCGVGDAAVSEESGEVEMLLIPFFIHGQMGQMGQKGQEEWHGVTVATRYDENGAVVRQYVSEIVFVAKADKVEMVYDAPVEGGRVQEPMVQDDRYLRFEIGRPLDRQAFSNSRVVNVSLAGSQFAPQRPFFNSRTWKWARCVAISCGANVLRCAWFGPEPAFAFCAGGACLVNAAACLAQYL